MDITAEYDFLGPCDRKHSYTISVQFWSVTELWPLET
jgi:hypothetical protein